MAPTRYTCETVRCSSLEDGIVHLMHSRDRHQSRHRYSRLRASRIAGASYPLTFRRLEDALPIVLMADPPILTDHDNINVRTNTREDHTCPHPI